jgi:hypothetical protein
LQLVAWKVAALLELPAANHHSRGRIGLPEHGGDLAPQRETFPPLLRG